MADQNRLRRISIILFVLALISLAVHMESLVRFNRGGLAIHGADSSSGISLEIDARKDSTSTWLKRSFLLDDGRSVNLVGQTVDATLENSTEDAIRDWELRINIAGDCYINQAWNGEVEIHQFVGTEKERVQRMNLQNYQLEDVTFKYRYDGDLLIPLQAGDYVVYYPSVRFGEMPLEGGDDIRFGMIFYFLDQLDLSDYDVTCHMHRSFTQGVTFYPTVVLIGLWLLTVAFNVATVSAYRRARKELELRKSGIFSMSDIYDVIYIIQLDTGEMTPVSVDEKLERERPRNRPAKELLREMIQKDAEEKYRDMMLEFVDTDTLAERLKDRSSVVSEFVSKQYGWCTIRFCAMDRAEGKPVESVIFAVQNINEEKQELEAITAQIERAESDNQSRSDLMNQITQDLHAPLQQLMEQIDRVQRMNRDPEMEPPVREMRSIGTRLLTLTESMVDSMEIRSGKIQQTTEAYSLRQLLSNILRDILPTVEQNGIDLSVDIAENLPDRLQGDPRLLQEVLTNLAFGVMKEAEKEDLHLSMYGKTLGEKVHLLCSVRVLREQEKTGTREGTAPEKSAMSEPSRLNLEIAADLLSGMGSELRTVRTPAGREEYYFEKEQQVLDSIPVGKISLDTLRS